MMPNVHRLLVVTVMVEPRRVLLAGDVHGNAEWMERLVHIAQSLGCEVVVQLGDFGYFPLDQSGQWFLRRVEQAASGANLIVYWIDGNHEDHGQLGALRPTESGFTPVSDRCFYIPRGLRWTWSGVRFGALGGAFSVDWRQRTPGADWWPQEVPTDA